MRPFTPIALLCICAALAAAPVTAQAAVFASEVVSYDPGVNELPTIFGTSLHYDQPQVAVGSPDGLTGETDGFPSVLSPFSGAYERDEIVAVGEQGHLTLKFAAPVYVGAGYEIGVIANVSLYDQSYPNGQAYDPALTTSTHSAVVEVSADNAHWVSLGSITFDIPANFYTDSGPFDSVRGTQEADFGKAFVPAGGLSAFDGLDNSGILTLLDGSGGGTWIDLGGTGLSQIQYIRFSVPDDGQEFIDSYAVIDAVAVNNLALLPQPAPEPASVALLVLGGAACSVWRRRRS
ncbi:MAG: hypothetical protein BIFFINMI_04134 [Phycisphaerae bacterium]|nr:hypothetical protein [Phycisphaerae bacterium]